MKFSFLFLLFIPKIIFAQEEFTTGRFTLKLNENLLTVKEDSNHIYERKFSSLQILFNDLDGDNIDEVLIIDSAYTGFTVFIYNLIDGFNFIDSIASGQILPTVLSSEDVEGSLISTGNAAFQEFGSSSILPLNIHKYESGELFLVNDEVYDLFIIENELLVEFMSDEIIEGDCLSSKEMISVIAAAYVNLINAGELTAASQLLKKYYFCNDIEEFKLRVENLLTTEGTLDEDGME